MKHLFLKQTSLIVICFLSSFLISCKKENILEPSNAIALNMLNESNGKTILGESDVYISKANNFTAKSTLIADCGKSSGLGENIAPELNNLAQEVAVTTGNYYQLFNKYSVKKFPSGVMAAPLNTIYYKVFVESAIVDNEKITGAKVKYVGVYPKENRLPKWGEFLGDIYKTNDGEIEFTLPNGAECFFVPRNSLEEGSFKVTTIDNRLVIKLLKSPNKVYGPYGNYNVYIRLGNIFSSVRFDVDVD